ncbi:MAG: PIN domain-containing protein [Gaiellaceae bacterium]
MSLYLDSSALVKLVADEPESAALQVIVGGASLVSSEIARVEVARAARRHAAEDVGRELLDRLFEVELTAEILEAAAAAEPPELSSLDAIHLASALANSDGIDAFVAYDERLLAAAEAAGLAVASPA